MRQEKQLLLDDLKEQVEASDSFVVTQYDRLTVAESEQLRDEVAQAGANYTVVRKRVFAKAVAEAGIEGFDVDTLAGSIGVLFAKEDPVASAKAAFKFHKDNKEKFTVAAGYVDGQLVTAAQVEQLSELPSKDELRAQFVGLLEAPMSQTLATMDAILTSVLHCMDNKVEKEGGAA